MMSLLQPLWERVNIALGSQPIFALALGAALLALFLSILLRADPNAAPSLAWAIWIRLGRLTWAMVRLRFPGRWVISPGPMPGLRRSRTRLTAPSWSMAPSLPLNGW